MRIVFLDFDGVLNSDAFFKVHGLVRDKLDVAAVARLRAIVRATAAKVVVSSTWRLGYTLAQLTEILRAHGFDGEVIGVTPHAFPSRDPESIPARYSSRAHEITAWLEAQPGPPQAFVILDDAPDMGHLSHRHVGTTFELGLCDEHVERAIALLESQM